MYCGYGFPVIGSYMDRASGSEDGTDLSGVHRIYSNSIYKMTSQNRGQGWFGTELSRLHEDIYALKKVVDIFYLCAYPDFSLLCFTFSTV